MNNLDFSFLFNNRLRFIYNLNNLDLGELRTDLYNFALFISIIVMILIVNTISIIMMVIWNIFYLPRALLILLK